MNSTSHYRAERVARLLYQEQAKLAVINVLTNGEGTCRWCGQGDIDVLCLDHINDNGKRSTIRRSNPYTALITRNYADAELFQVLCASCNLKKEVLRRRRKWYSDEEEYARHHYPKGMVRPAPVH